jgi:succinyl-CoA synthetase beta subunit/citryl-CoA synthetase large subunit
VAKLLEDAGKAIAREHGLVVPRGEAAASVAQAREIAARLACPVVVKALVPTGKRGRAGAVRFAAGPDEAAEHAQALLGAEVGGFVAHGVLVEEQLAIAEELYLAITFSGDLAVPVAVLGRAGGVDVEDAWQADPQAFRRLPVDPLGGLRADDARAAWRSLGLAADIAARLGELTRTAWEMYAATEAVLLEINPLALTAAGRAVVAAVMLEVDDEALFRHPELAGVAHYAEDRFQRELTPRERDVLAADRSDPARGALKFMELEGGDIGFLITGGGGSMVAFDVLERLGGRPANYVDVSPGFTLDKLVALTRAVLSVPGVRGLVIGGARKVNMPVDQFVEALVICCDELGIDTTRFPVVARLVGLNQDRARELAGALEGFECYGDEVLFDDVLERIVERIG